MAQQQMPRIESTQRDRTGSRYAARLRQTGRLPAVVYGHGQDPLHISLDAKGFTDVLHHNAHLIELVVDSRTEPCLIKDVQWDHLGRSIIHVDLARVDLNEEVEVEVGIELAGEPAALKEAGAVLEHPLSELSVRCKANAIPESIVVDVSELKMDEMLTVADLKLPEGVEAVTDPETMVARLSVVAEVTEEETTPAEGAAEPEVIGRGKAEEEGGEAAE